MAAYGQTLGSLPLGLAEAHRRVMLSSAQARQTCSMQRPGGPARRCCRWRLPSDVKHAASPAKVPLTFAKYLQVYSDPSTSTQGWTGLPDERSSPLSGRKTWTAPPFCWWHPAQLKATSQRGERPPLPPMHTSMRRRAPGAPEALFAIRMARQNRQGCRGCIGGALRAPRNTAAAAAAAASRSQGARPGQTTSHRVVLLSLNDP